MLTVVRIWLPAAIAVAGIVLIVVGGDAARGAGIVLVGVAALVVLANLFIRLGLSSEADREREEERRRARWPGGGER
jgi:drug/metabolite transporter (DMT)-like permease